MEEQNYEVEAEYYAAAIIFALADADEESFSIDEIREVGFFHQNNAFFIGVNGGEKILINDDIFYAAIKRLKATKLLDFLNDPYGDDVVINQYGVTLAQESRVLFGVVDKVLQFNRKRGSWLVGALRRINEAYPQEIYNDEQRVLPEKRGDDLSWEPLPIDRVSSEYENAIEAWEDGLQKIEGDNGFADSEPDTRNGIVETLRGGLNAVKEGAPSKTSVLNGPVAAFKYVAKKFGDSIVGVAAKKAVEAILALLF